MAFGSTREGLPDARGDKPRRARPVTREWLQRAAAHYLERYASSTENLRRVLERKVARREREAALLAADEDGDRHPRMMGADHDAMIVADHAGMIEETIARFLELRLLDDRAFAEARFASLRRRGTSLRQAEAKLSQKGVDRETVAGVLGTDETGDRAAAFAYAKRRRLGPHRLRERAERRERDLAAMMRAGFGYGDARAAIDAEGEEMG